MHPALVRHLLLMTLLLVALTLYATTLGAMRLPLINLLPSGDEILRNIWLTIRLPRVLLALLVGRRLWHRFRGQPDRADLDRPDPIEVALSYRDDETPADA